MTVTCCSAGIMPSIVGFFLHMIISILRGVSFALLFGNRCRTYGQGLICGLVWGAVWWVLWPLLIMPAMMGMPMFAITMDSIGSLMGHLLFGGVMGAAFAWFDKR